MFTPRMAIPVALAALALVSGCQSSGGFKCCGSEGGLMSRLGFRGRSPVVYEDTSFLASPYGGFYGGGYSGGSVLGSDCCGDGAMPYGSLTSGPVVGGNVIGGGVVGGNSVPMVNNRWPTPGTLQPVPSPGPFQPGVSPLPLPGEPPLANRPGNATPTPANPSMFKGS